MKDLELTAPAPEEYPATHPNVLTALGQFDPAQPLTEIRLADGRTSRISTSILLQASGIEKSPAEPVPETVQELPSNEASEVVIPLVEERLQVGRRTVATGKIRLQKTVQEYTESLDEVLAVRSYDVERRILNQPVDAPPPVRQEGNVTIYSLVEEQMVLTRQLILKEEVHIVQRDTERRDTQVITLHKDHLTIEREDAS